MLELTNKELIELKKECEENIYLHPLVIQILEEVKAEIEQRLDLEFNY